MFKNILKGIVIGIANVLPGVSGGTLAVVLNVYDKLTESIGNFFLAPFEKKKEYIKFLLQIGIGAAIGIVVFAGIISKMYEGYPRITTLIFLILIIPSIPLILKGEKFFKKNNLIFFGLGVIFTIGFIFLTKYFVGDEIALINPESISSSYAIKLFVCGVIAAGAMVIPGISGSLLLILMGEYYNIMGYIKGFKLIPLFFFGLGVAIGLVAVSKLINILLNKYRSYTLNFIVGIIVVSLFQIAAILI